MIASRRRAHRWLVCGLAPVAAVVFVSAVLSRAPEPRVASLPPFPTARPDLPSAAIGDAQWTREYLFVGWPARVAGYAGGILELKPLRPLQAPDVLVYWSPTIDAGPSLPGDAHLIGRLGGPVVHRFRLPHADASPHASGAVGRLVLYSLGHQEVLAQATLPALAGGAPR